MTEQSDAPMTEATDAATTEAPETPAPRRNNSRVFRSATKIKIAPENARRQGEITKLAFLVLGSSEAAIALLNQPHADLGARPLDIATASDEGYADVERVIRRLAEPINAGK